MTALVLRSDARCLPLAANSADLIVTSPPYFGLRSYTDGGEHYAGQVGDEATPAEFLDALIGCTAEWLRVLKPSGSLWVNLGDKYAGGNVPHALYGPRRGRWGAQSKSLIGLPWRYALRCIDELGLILRAEVIWSKPNGLPESVTDRVRRSHEQWFHLTLEPRYFAAVDEIREPHLHPLKGGGEKHGRHDRGRPGFARHSEQTPHPLGKLPGSVWEVVTEPLRVPDVLGVDHFAAFPTEWPRRIILGWSPSGVCEACGEGRRPLVMTDLGRKERNTPQYDATGHARHGTGSSTLGSRGSSAVITGYACACPDTSAQTRPAVVLDPFGGTGTTALVASALGRIGISVDLSHDYSRLAQWRTTDPSERAKAMRVDKPPLELEDQLDLFGGAA